MATRSRPMSSNCDSLPRPKCQFQVSKTIPTFLDVQERTSATKPSTSRTNLNCFSSASGIALKRSAQIDVVCGKYFGNLVNSLPNDFEVLVVRQPVSSCRNVQYCTARLKAFLDTSAIEPRCSCCWQKRLSSSSNEIGAAKLATRVLNQQKTARTLIRSSLTTFEKVDHVNINARKPVGKG